MDTTTNNSTRQDWMLFALFAVITIALLVYADEWFWLTLPFVLTFLVKALRAM